MTTFELLTLIVGPTALVATNVTTHLFTRGRERNSQVRTRQIDTGQAFRDTVVKLIAYFKSPPAEIRNIAVADEIELAPTFLVPHLIDINAKIHPITSVGTDSMISFATLVSNVLPRLAYQAIRLPGVHHPVARQQTAAAVEAMSQLEGDLAALLRWEIGLVPKKNQAVIRDEILNAPYRQLALPIVDRPSSTSVDLGAVLRSWEVLPLNGDRVPDDITGYQMDDLLMGDFKIRRSDGKCPQAVALKLPAEPWRYGVLRNLQRDMENEIVSDAIRLITGHVHAFQLRYQNAEPNPTGPGHLWWWDIEKRD